jgi:quercetin dioxygenase-like cupin family protein
MIQYRAMPDYNWNQIQEETLSPLLGRKMIHSRNLTVARIRLNKGAMVPLHSHANEQMSMIESGCLRFVVAGAEMTLRAGDVLVIPPDVPHLAEALEDSIAVDIFSPPRQDWISGNDAYLRNAGRR